MGEGFAALETVILLVQNSVENRCFFLCAGKKNRADISVRPADQIACLTLDALIDIQILLGRMIPAEVGGHAFLLKGRAQASLLL